ncbi:MAG: DUF4249 family protein [Bacteroidales bacterium]
MRNRLISGIACVLAFFMLVGCEEFSTADPDQVVVQGFLFPGRTAEISVNHQLVIERGDTLFDSPVSDLVIRLTDLNSDENEYLQEGDSGVYHSTLRMKADNSYRIEFDYQGKRVWAETTIPSNIENFKGDAESLVHTERFSDDTLRYVNYTWDNPKGYYHLISFTHMESWSTPIYNYEPTSRTITNNPTLDTTHQVNSRGFYYYGRHYVVLCKLNQEYVDLYYNSTSNSQHMGNPPTNIHNGFGIFTGINTDTLMLRLW